MNSPASGSLWLTFLLILSFAATAPAVSGDERDPRYAILLAGVSGDPALQKMYLEEIQKLHSILVGPLGFPRDQVIVLFDNPELDPERIRYRSTRQGLGEACLHLSQRVKKSDLVFVFIDGHGSYDGKTYKLNLVGPDTTAWELAEILYSIPAGRFIVVNATSCSGGGLQALSGGDRIVITATRSGMENNLAHMGGYFVESLENNAADSDKNDRVSVLEAFIYTNRKVEDYYKNEDKLQTEHPVLEDNGDGQGQSDPNPETREGLLARTTFLSRPPGRETLGAITDDQRKIMLEAWELEEQIEALKYKKAEMPRADYERKLEELLLNLARTNAKLPE
ncbi:MAG: caspase family protein [Acidobacteria bacterium]|nr:caspase family protein [Acidobacteriota bacterium]